MQNSYLTRETFFRFYIRFELARLVNIVVIIFKLLKVMEFRWNSYSFPPSKLCKFQRKLNIRYPDKTTQNFGFKGLIWFQCQWLDASMVVMVVGIYSWIKPMLLLSELCWYDLLKITLLFQLQLCYFACCCINIEWRVERLAAKDKQPRSL